MVRLFARRTRLASVFAVAAIALTFVSLGTPSAEASQPTTTVDMPASVRAAILAAENDANVAVAVLDTQTGKFYGSAADDTQFPAESVVKVLIAANLLATGQMSGDTEQMAYQMITESDDDDADALWGTVGGPEVISWAQARYGIADLGAAPTQFGWWGNTKFTARGLVELYAAIRADPVVGPWLIDAMSHMAATADDGTDQDFGLAGQTTVGAFKQGWGGDDDADNSEQLNSTGLLDGNRYAVAILVQHVPYEPLSTLLPVMDAVAAAVAPQGQVTLAAAPPPAAQASTPQASPDPAPTVAASPEPSSSAAPSSSASTPEPAGIGTARLLAGRLIEARQLLDGRASGFLLAGVVLLAAAAVIGRLIGRLIGRRPGSGRRR